MYSREVTRYEGPSLWPFEIRQADQLRAERRLASGFAGTDIVTLGPPQASIPGVRLIGPIVEMSQSLETMKKYGLGLPYPKIFCPIHINAWANAIPIEANERMAEFYQALARRYFATFHPQLPLPELVVDTPELASAVANHAEAFAQRLPSEVLAELRQMSNNHTSAKRGVEQEVKAAGYLLAHFVVYGWLPRWFHERSTLLLVPGSETRFEELMFNSAPAARDMGLSITIPKEDQEGPLIVGYSTTIRSPHYYCHKGEPTLAACINQWPRPSAIRGGIKGLNGHAQREIVEVVELIERDITTRQKSRDGINRDLVRIDLLQKQVLRPLADEIYSLTDELPGLEQ